MKLEDTWKDLSEQSQSINPSEVLKSIKNKDMDVLAKLQRKLLFKIDFTITFTVLYTLILFFIKDWIVSLLFIVILVFHIGALIYFLKEYQSMKKLIPMDGNIKETLSTYLKRIKQVIRNEERVGVFLYPLALSAGFFLSLISKISWEEFMQDRTALITWIVSMIVFTPVGHFMGKKMNKISFGKQISKLEGMISEIENTNEK